MKRIANCKGQSGKILKVENRKSAIFAAFPKISWHWKFRFVKSLNSFQRVMENAAKRSTV
jgi:hypothetical protein